MLKKSSWAFCLLLVSLIFVGCKKEKIEHASTSDHSDVKSTNTYMSNLPEANKQEREKVFNQIISQSSQNRGVETLWGLGTDWNGNPEYGRVFRWNGTSWDEPNPAARLFSISQGSYSGTWGLGGPHTAGARRIFKWNGTSWDEPNPGANLYEIEALTNLVDLGVGGSGRMYITTNGGLSWSLYHSFDPSTIIHGLSVAVNNSNFAWLARDFNEVIYQSSDYATWTSRHTYGAPVYCTAADMLSSDAYILLNNGALYRLQYVGGSVINTVNATAPSFLDMSSKEHGVIWGIGPDRRVYKSIDEGATWNQPNPAARLDKISVGFEN